MLKKLSLIALSVAALNANAASFGVAECYSLPHGVNGQGSSNTVMIPAFEVGPSNSLKLLVTNIDSKGLNFKVTLRDQDGNLHTPSDYELGGNFDLGANSPLAGQTGGTALLKSFEVGTVKINESAYTGGPLTAQLSWQVDSCDSTEIFLTNISPKVAVAVEHQSPNGVKNINLVNTREGNQF